jgi:hypothetical protein
MPQLTTSPGNSSDALANNKRIVSGKTLFVKGKKRNKHNELLADFSWEKYLEEIEELVEILKPKSPTVPPPFSSRSPDSLL